MTIDPNGNSQKPSSATNAASFSSEQDERTRSQNTEIEIPSDIAGSGSLDKLVEKARDYAVQSTAENTNKAYAKDWAHFSSWCRRCGAEPLVPDPKVIGLYITELASPQSSSARSVPPLAVSTIERRLSGLSWNYKQRGQILDRGDRHIATVLAGIRRQHAKPPKQKEAIMGEDIIKMISILPFDLRGMRDKTILLIGYAGGLRRSEIVGLDMGPDQTEDSRGWIEVAPDNEDDGALLILKGKTGWREVEIGRGSTDATCPIHAFKQWIHYGKISHGPIFRAVTRDHSSVKTDRLSDKHVARLIKQCVEDAGIRTDLPLKERLDLFSGHSLRAGLVSIAL